MDFEIIPSQGVGILRFGMPRTDIRQCFAYPPVEQDYCLEQAFWDTNTIPSEHYEQIDSEELIDVFVHDGVRVIYEIEPPHPCIAICFFTPAKPLFYGKNLLLMKVVDLQKLFHLLDEPLVHKGDGLCSYKFGIYVYIEGPKELKNLNPDEIMVFTQAYLSDE